MSKINVQSLNDILCNNSENIVKILNKLNYEHIKDRGKYITFPNHNGDNLNACSILKSTLVYQNFSHGKSGNLYTLIMDELECSFPDALNKIAGWLGLKQNNIKIHYPFSGFYKKIIQEQNDPESTMKIYNDDCLPPQDSFSKMFIDDGISIDAQKKFGVRYCHEDDCILIPIYNINYDMVGVKARNNSNDDFNNRWYAWIPYSKTNVVYGLNWNYTDIISKKTLIIFESEKSVMKAYDCGLNCTCAIAGHSISNAQANIIKSLMVDNIIVAFDESICEDEIKYEAKKLIVDNQIYQNKVTYLYDDKNIYLPKGEKDAPIDLGKEVFKNILKNCRKEINNE